MSSEHGGPSSGHIRDAADCGSFARLVELLWTERNLLRCLQFRLCTHRLLVAAGEWEWLAYADDEVRTTSERLQQVEVLRCAEAEALAELIGLSPAVTLADLAARAPEPWPEILADHATALRELTAAVDNSAADIEQLINRGETVLGSENGERP